MVRVVAFLVLMCAAAEPVAALVDSVEHAADAGERQRALFALQAAVLLDGTDVVDDLSLRAAGAALVEGIASDLATNDEHYDSSDPVILLRWHTLDVLPGVLPPGFTASARRPIGVKLPWSRRKLGGITEAQFQVRSPGSAVAVMSDVRSGTALGLSVHPPRRLGDIVRVSGDIVTKDPFLYGATWITLVQVGATPRPLGTVATGVFGHCASGDCYASAIEATDRLLPAAPPGVPDPSFATAIDVTLRRLDLRGGWDDMGFLRRANAEYGPLLRGFKLQDPALGYGLARHIAALTGAAIPRDVILAWLRSRQPPDAQAWMVRMLRDRPELDIPLVLECAAGLAPEARGAIPSLLKARALAALAVEGAFEAGPSGELDRVAYFLMDEEASGNQEARSNLVEILDRGIALHGVDAPLSGLPPANPDKPWVAAKRWGDDLLRLTWQVRPYGGQVFWIRREGVWTRLVDMTWIE